MSKKSSTNFVYSILFGLLILCLLLVVNHLDFNINTKSISAFSILGAIIVYLLLTPKSYNKIKYYFNELDWADEVIKYYQSIPSLYRKSFWISFGFINLAFLFHTINFMWGATDWEAVRFNVDNASAIKDGNFTAFTLQNILFGGKILPVINNLWSFFGLSLSGILLAYYWNMPKKTSTYVITSLFMAVTPYTLSIMYFTQYTLGNLWLPAFIIGGLILSNKATQTLNRSYLYNLLSISLFIIALGTYLPIINFFGIVLLGKIFLNVITKGTSLRDNFFLYLQALANFTASVLIYIFVILLLKLNGNAISISNVDFYDAIQNIPSLISSMFTQFATTIPFVDLSYKIIALIIVITSIFAVIFKAPSTKASIKGLALIPCILVSSKISYLFNADTNSILHGYNSFYSLPILYTLMYATLIKLDGEYLKRFAYTLAVLLIFMSFVRISYGLKVWKFGFDAETKLAERIITRMEKMDNFNIDKKYKLLQIGSKSLRHKYYIKKDSEQKSPELLDLAYYDEKISKDAYNFFYQADFLSKNVTIKEASQNEALKNFILKDARSWPDKNSIFIHDDYIVFVLDDKALYKAQQELSK